METRKGWGMVVWSSIFALAIILVAGATYFFENNGALPFLSAKNTSPDDEDGDGLYTWEELAWHTDPKKADTDGDGATDGAEVRAGTNPAVPGASGNPYESWGGFSPSQHFALDIATAQEAYNQSSTSADSYAIALKSITDKVQVPDLTEKIPYTALRIGTSTDVTLYGQIVVGILQKSLDVRRDELVVFKHTIEDRNYLGTPELKQDATVYKSIEAALLAIQVPQAVATEHLALINAVGTLANVVSAMGNWGGDPVAGLAYMDALLKTQSRSRGAMNNLFDAISHILNT